MFVLVKCIKSSSVKMVSKLGVRDNTANCVCLVHTHTTVNSVNSVNVQDLLSQYLLPLFSRVSSLLLHLCLCAKGSIASRTRRG